MTYTYDEQTFSDLYKDVNGFRPRSHEFYTATPDRKQVIWESLIEDLESENNRIQDRRNKSVTLFESLVDKTISMGATDRKTAVQWLVDAEDDDFYDYGYMEFKYDLPCGYIQSQMT